MENNIKHCLSCNKPLKGRIDKKFCDDYCRSNYNNLQKSKNNGDGYVKKINLILFRNRKVLQELLPDKEEMQTTTLEKLVQAGFSLKYYTHTYTTKKEQTYFFCYDYGYLPLENNRFLLVRRKENL